jgi:hypothetical protein
MAGETGILLVRERLAPSAATRDRLRELIAANVGDERCDLLWGSPGTMLAARELGFDDLWQESADRLLADRDPETGLWTQKFGEKSARYLGAAHGFAGCVLGLGSVEGAAETARRYAVVEEDVANWPPSDDGELVHKGTIRVQWCHGAPGMITSLGDGLDVDLALAGGELTWQAGPIAKGAGLCHGTAGNGYAFLTLLERTGNELWLDRARRFARALDQPGRGLPSRARQRVAQPLDGRPRGRALPRRLRRGRRAPYRFRSSQSAATTRNTSRTGSIAGFQVTSPFLIT